MFHYEEDDGVFPLGREWQDRFIGHWFPGTGYVLILPLLVCIKTVARYGVRSFLRQEIGFGFLTSYAFTFEMAKTARSPALTSHK
jgi:hypothetical protein